MAMDSHPVTSSCCPDHAHDHSHEHAHQHEHSTSSSENTGAGSSEAAAELSLEQASQLVRYNAFGDAFEDLAAAALRGARMPHSHVGCWPAFSLFNHSCVPNTVHYVVGQNMVVRATEDVPAGWSMCDSSSSCRWQRVAVCVASVWHAMLRAGMLLIRCANSFWPVHTSPAAACSSSRPSQCTVLLGNKAYDMRYHFVPELCIVPMHRSGADSELPWPRGLCASSSTQGSAAGALWV